MPQYVAYIIVFWLLVFGVALILYSLIITRRWKVDPSKEANHTTKSKKDDMEDHNARSSVTLGVAFIAISITLALYFIKSESDRKSRLSMLSPALDSMMMNYTALAYHIDVLIYRCSNSYNTDNCKINYDLALKIAVNTTPSQQISPILNDISEKYINAQEIHQLFFDVEIAAKLKLFALYDILMPRFVSSTVNSGRFFIQERLLEPLPPIRDTAEAAAMLTCIFGSAVRSKSVSQLNEELILINNELERAKKLESSPSKSMRDAIKKRAEKIVSGNWKCNSLLNEFEDQFPLMKSKIL